MSEKNLHWAITADLTRRGERKNRNTRILPDHVDGMVAQLRETNQRVHGEQPIVANHDWWQKTAVSQNTLGKPTVKGAAPVPGWGITKRELDWTKVDKMIEHTWNSHQTISSPCSSETAKVLPPSTMDEGWVAVASPIPALLQLRCG